MIPCWNTTGWSLPPKTGTTTIQRTTAPPSTTVPGGTATATRPTWTASTCAGSTLPTQTALSGPPGPAGSTPSSFPRWRFGLPAIWKTNKLFFCSCELASSSHLVCWPKHTILTFVACPHMILFLLPFLYYSATCSMLASIIHLWPFFHWNHAAIVIFFSIQFIKTAHQRSCAGPTRGGPEKSGQRAVDFPLTSDLPYVLTCYLNCGSVSLPVSVPGGNRTDFSKFEEKELEKK